MAEEEKINHHAKQALRSLTNKKKKWKERIKDFFYEIFIIIVAVSITLWFHNWSDKRNDRKLAKEFLIDIRANLVQDTVKLKSNIKFMTDGPIAYYDSVLTQISRNKINAGYVDSNSMQLISDTYLIFDYGAFQSFSSSGNLRLIENRKLSSDITYLYTSLLPFREQIDKEIFQKRFDDYKKYIGSKIGIDSTLSGHVSSILNQPEVKFQFQINSVLLKAINKNRYDVIKQIVLVIHEIDKELEPPAP